MFLLVPEPPAWERTTPRLRLLHPPQMFKIKICGITSPEDALLAADAGADAIGLNFYEKSPRYVTPDLADQISDALAEQNWTGSICGVYVNAEIDQITETAATDGIGFIQLHGDEPPALVANLRQWFDKMAQVPTQNLPWYRRWLAGAIQPFRLEIVRAVRCRADSLAPLRMYLEECLLAGGLPHAILLDAHTPGAYGGTGQTLDWAAIPSQRDQLLGLPLILAGGLTPENVADAIRLAHPDAVDVASGVESSPGKKDPAKLRDFIAAAKQAFADL